MQSGQRLDFRILLGTRLKYRSSKLSQPHPKARSWGSTLNKPRSTSNHSPSKPNTTGHWMKMGILLFWKVFIGLSSKISESMWVWSRSDWLWHWRRKSPSTSRSKAQIWLARYWLRWRLVSFCCCRARFISGTFTRCSCLEMLSCTSLSTSWIRYLFVWLI